MLTIFDVDTFISNQDRRVRLPIRKLSWNKGSMMYYYPFVAGPGELIAKGIARHDSPNVAMIQEAQDNPVKHATT